MPTVSDGGENNSTNSMNQNQEAQNQGAVGQCMRSSSGIGLIFGIVLAVIFIIIILSVYCVLKNKQKKTNERINPQQQQEKV